MFCKNCGATNGDNAAFCVNCGAALTEETVVLNEQPVKEQPAYEQPAQPVQPVYTQPVAPIQNTVVPGKGMGTASLVLGILSLTICCGATLPAIIGLILGIISAKNAKDAGMKNGTATAGIICSAIGLAFAVIFIAVMVVIMLAGGGATFADPYSVLYY